MKSNLSSALKTIVYIDDDLDDISTFHEIVSEINVTYKIKSYSDSSTALNELEEGVTKPDIVFVDMNMPRLSGKEVLMLIKRNRNLSAVPVIMYSTTIRNDDIQLLKELGANDFLTKATSVIEATKGIAYILKKHCEPGS